jgi:hypothetical protein
MSSFDPSPLTAPSTNRFKSFRGVQQEKGLSPPGLASFYLPPLAKFYNFVDLPKLPIITVPVFLGCAFRPQGGWFESGPAPVLANIQCFPCEERMASDPTLQSDIIR